MDFNFEYNLPMKFLYFLLGVVFATLLIVAGLMWHKMNTMEQIARERARAEVQKECLFDGHDVFYCAQLTYMDEAKAK